MKQFNQKRLSDQNRALSKLVEFPNFIAWMVFTDAGKSLAGSSHEEKHRAYEAEIDELLANVVKATEAAEEAA